MQMRSGMHLSIHLQGKSVLAGHNGVSLQHLETRPLPSPQAGKAACNRQLAAPNASLDLLMIQSRRRALTDCITASGYP